MCLQKNKIIMSGVMRTVPELRVVPNENLSICHFQLTQLDTRGNEMTFACKALKENAENLAKCPAGTSILVFGRLETNKYKSGNGYVDFREIVVSEVYPSVEGVYINKMQFAGRLTKDPLFYAGTEAKKSLARGSIAMTMNKGTDAAKTEFLDVVAFDQRAEFMNNHMRKADAITAEGRLVLEQYQAQDGPKISYKLYTYSVEFTQDKAVNNRAVTAALPQSAEQSSSLPPQSTVKPTADGFVPVGNGFPLPPLE